MIHLKLETERLYLISTEKQAIENLIKLNWSNYYCWIVDEKVNQFNSHGLFPQSQKELDNFFDRCENDKSLLSFMIIDKEINKHIGQCSLQRIDFINRSAEFAIVIGELDYHGKGYATECLNKLLSHGFLKLGLNRIWSATAEINLGMVKCFNKLGMTYEGTYREGQYLNGEFVNTVAYAILKKEYDNVKKRI